jgi:alkylhydroperoxidase family enzyme
VGAHAWFLQLQGGADEVIAALAKGDVAGAPLSEADAALMRFVELVTRHAYRSNQEDIDRLRATGWTDPQIAEAVYITALFAFFNRVADAFGLADPGYRDLARQGSDDVPKAPDPQSEIGKPKS